MLVLWEKAVCTTIICLARLSTRAKKQRFAQNQVSISIFLAYGSKLLMMRLIPNSKFCFVQQSVPITKFTMHRCKFGFLGSYSPQSTIQLDNHINWASNFLFISFFLRNSNPNIQLIFFFFVLLFFKILCFPYFAKPKKNILKYLFIDSHKLARRLQPSEKKKNNNFIVGRLII